MKTPQVAAMPGMTPLGMKPKPAPVVAHTPGPWKVIEGDRLRVAAELGEPVCHVPHWPGSQETENANARLIAAAPELLATLRMLACSELTIDQDHNRTPERLALRGDVWAVIAKAERRQP